MEDTPKADVLAKGIANGLCLVDAALQAAMPIDEASILVCQADFRDLIAKYVPKDDEVRQMFLNEAAASILTIREIRDAPKVDAKVRLSAAKDFLDRAGFMPTKRQLVARFNVSKEKATLIEATLVEVS